MAFQFGFNLQNEFEIQAYLHPQDGETFSEAEVKEAYLMASKDSEGFSKDESAAALFNEHVRPNRKQRRSKTYSVFTWEEGSPATSGPAEDVKPELGNNRSGAGPQEGRAKGSKHTHQADVRCVCCQTADFIIPPSELDVSKEESEAIPVKEAFLGKKYKPVALKVRPVFTELPERFRIKRKITGNPLEGMPGLSPNPVDYCPTGRYTADRKEIIDKIHEGDFLWLEERKLLHHFMMIQNEAFAWDDSERGSFRHDFFPPVEFPVIEHKVWVERSIPIPRGQLEMVCKIIKNKIDAGVYEPSNSSYRTKFFGVVKKDGKSIRLVHALEPLNAVTIAHSGVPPATEELANHFAGRACGACLDLYSGYDHRDIAENCRDFTTFQTPFGALRLVKLPQGWTNSVPIFHDDVTYILEDEIPKVTIPYIDDVPIRGPGTRYQDIEGNYETISGNSGIRRFVWEHFQNLNRVVQRIKYCGGTFSGTKALLYLDSFPVVGHICSYEGRRPSTDRVGVITRWGPLENVSEVRQFLGVVGQVRMFIKDYGSISAPISKLLRGDVTFVWGAAQEASMEAIKAEVSLCRALRPLDYDWPSDIVLAVDTSWMSVGIEIYQVDPVDPKKRYFAKFHSIPLNERESRFSQPKRELYGLLRALMAMQYWLLGCRKLVVETDALYIKGMLANPGMGPNATINRWIEQILMFHFKLKHVAGKTFAPDGLSRRRKQPGDEEVPNLEIGYDDNPPPEDHPEWEQGIPQPLSLEDFKHDIDTRGGYEQQVVEMPTWEGDFVEECLTAFYSEAKIDEVVKSAYLSEGLPVPQYIMSQVRDEEPLMPELKYKLDPEHREDYPEGHRSGVAKELDDRLELVKEWLKDPLIRPKEIRKRDYPKFVRYASLFFLDKDSGRLYRRDDGGAHKLVVSKEYRMYMMRGSHDSLGHKGAYATKCMIELRFWWPDYTKDVEWYVKTCHLCQVRQKTLLRIPPVPTMTPSVFQKIHTDVMIMGVPSNGYRLVVAARDSLTRYLEARALKADNGESLGKFLLEDIICRWGCPKWIVTDNAPQFIAALKWLSAKYGIVGIRISAYNSQANGPVETGHWDMRQSLYKATGGDTRKWFWFLPQVIWADRITTRRGLGCSPYFAICGAHPVIPLDLEEATWLVEFPGKIISTAELIGLRARALAKHTQHVEEMRDRVDAEKLLAARRYEKDHEHTIKDYNFKAGSIVLIRNTVVEKSLNTKMSTRYLGPCVVVRRTKGGSYLCCEMNGAMMHGRIAQFRLVPYMAREEIDLSEDILELIDLSKEVLEDLAAAEDDEDEYLGKDMQFHKIRLRPDWQDANPDDLSDEYVSEEEIDEVIEPTPVYDEANPRRSKRGKTLPVVTAGI